MRKYFLGGSKSIRRGIHADRHAPGLFAVPSVATETGWAAEDFYSILGVHPAADTKAIKAAYYELMRSYHPDQSSSVDTNEFCALLNEIYRTLSEPESRAVYDAIAGFSADALNPFLDTSYPADQVFVDEVSCIGCGKCVRACPAAFFIEASKYGRARVVPGADMSQLEEEVQVAIETCPVDCIYWVSSPQLSLLETALARMDRVDAFIMLRNHRSPGNVFDEANRAWQKRQAHIAAIRKQHEYSMQGSSSSSGSFFSSGWASFFSQHVEFKSSTSTAYSDSNSHQDSSSREYEESHSEDPNKRHIAGLAAAASKAMRRWRLHHSVVTAAAQKVLTE